MLLQSTGLGIARESTLSPRLAARRAGNPRRILRIPGFGSSFDWLGSPTLISPTALDTRDLATHQRQ